MKYHDSVPQWIRDLKEGDVVCDCRFKHIKIKSIENCPAPGQFPSFLCAEWIPIWIFDILLEIHEWCCKKFNYIYIYDRNFILEDGSRCSALHCCDSTDHIWEHPEE